MFSLLKSIENQKCRIEIRKKCIILFSKVRKRMNSSFSSSNIHYYNSYNMSDRSGNNLAKTFFDRNVCSETAVDLAHLLI